MATTRPKRNASCTSISAGLVRTSTDRNALARRRGNRGRAEGSHAHSRKAARTAATTAPSGAVTAGIPSVSSAPTATTPTSTTASATVSTSVAPRVRRAGTPHRRRKYTGATTLVNRGNTRPGNSLPQTTTITSRTGTPGARWRRYTRVKPVTSSTQKASV